MFRRVKPSIFTSGMVVLELYMEVLKLKKVQTMSTVTYDTKLNFLKAFILEEKHCNDPNILPKLMPSIQEKGINIHLQPLKNKHHNDMHQNIIISGPELSYTTDTE